MKCKTIIAIQIALIPVLLQIFWQIHNNALPVADGGDHFRIAYLIYLNFSESLAHGFDFLFHTGGKPILFSAFAAPFIPLFQFNQLLPIIAFITIVQVITTIAYFWLLSFRIDHIKSAVLAGLITTSPYLFSLHTQFMPEILWHMWFVIFLGLLLRSEELSNKLYSAAAGIALGLTILARPAESVLLLSPALVVYFYYLHKKGRQSLGKLLLNVFLLIAAVVGSSLVSWFNWKPAIGLLFIALITIIYFKTTSAANPAKNLFLLLTITLSSWLMFYARHILFWAYDNSFGAGAKTNDQVNLSKSVFLILYDVIGVYGIALTISLLLAAIFVRIFRNREEEDNNENKNLLYILFALVGILFPMLAAYSITGTSDSRRIMLGVVFLFITASYYIGYRKIYYKTIAFPIWFVLVIVFAAQSLAITFVSSGQSVFLDAKTSLEKYLGALKYTHANPNKSYDSEVINHIKSIGVTNSKIAVFSLGLFSDKMLYQAESLRYVTLGIDRSLEFLAFWGYVQYEPYLTVIQRLVKNDFDFVLLEDLDNPISDPAYRSRVQSHTFFVTDVLNIIRKNGPSNIQGLQLVESFDIDNRKQYLFRVYDPFGPKIIASSQLNGFSPNGLLDQKQPGWHSQSFPIYPQTITLEYKDGMSFSKIGFLPQDGGAARGPRSVEIFVSNDGAHWQMAGGSTDVCTSNDGDWHDLKIKSYSNLRFVRIVIHSNCGSPDLLTLRGLRIM